MKSATHAICAVTLAILSSGTVLAKDSVSIGMRLEPAPGLDPTTGAAAAISQVTLYNIFEGLTRLDGGGDVHPMLAKSWTISDDGTTYTFALEQDVKYHDGADFDSADVKAQFERNAGPESANKQKGLFRALKAVETPDAHTVVIRLDGPRSLLPFELAQAPAANPGRGQLRRREYQPDRHRTLPLREVDQGRLGRDGEVRQPSQRGERADREGEVPVHQTTPPPRSRRCSRATSTTCRR